MHYPLYEHLSSGMRVPITPEACDRYPANIAETKDELLVVLAQDGVASGDMDMVRGVVDELRENWNYVGWPTLDMIAETTEAVLSKAELSEGLVLILPWTRGPDGRALPGREELRENARYCRAVPGTRACRI